MLVGKLQGEMNGIRIINRNKRRRINFIDKIYQYWFITLYEEDKIDLQNKIEDIKENTKKKLMN